MKKKVQIFNQKHSEILPEDIFSHFKSEKSLLDNYQVLKEKILESERKILELAKKSSPDKEVQKLQKLKERLLSKLKMNQEIFKEKKSQRK